MTGDCIDRLKKALDKMTDEKSYEPIGFQQPQQASWSVLSGCCIMSIGYGIIVQLDEHQSACTLLGYLPDRKIIVQSDGYDPCVLEVDHLKQIIFPGWCIPAVQVKQ